ncbi:hypothetical protein Tco_0838163 [Tanacetum coccineum]|uniref:Uncharacterized protein n=1 Tax=Tanacetum coccineum TaxID=301880 RepID=A0ABQ5AN11_9ASTR
MSGIIRDYTLYIERSFLHKSGGEEIRMKTEGASFTQRRISSISIGGSISSEGFLSSLLLVVIIVMVVIVVVILIVIVVAIVGVVIVVMIFGVVVVVDDVYLIFKLLFVIIGVQVGPVFLLGLLALAIVSASAFRAEEMPLVMSCWMVAKVMAGVSDVDVLLGGILSIEDNTGYGMIHNDANDGDDDEREISWK